MSRLKARRLIRDHAQRGNWRFKALLLAALPDSPVSRKDVAKAWPTKPGDYRFLQSNPRYDPEQEAQRMLLAEEGTEDHRFLMDYAKDATKEVDASQHHLAGGDTKIHTARLDEAIQHALFAASTVEEVDTLFRAQLADVVAEGAQRRQVARDGAFVFNANTNSGDVPVADDRQYSYTDGSGGLAEGGIIPDDREGYSTVAWDCKKLGVGARITDEMIRHAQVDLIERQIAHVGEVVENDINRIWLNALVDNANQSHTAASSTERGVPALNGGVTQVDLQDFQPDTFVSHPEFRQELFDDSNLVLVNQSGTTDELRERQIAQGRVMGLDHLAMNQAAYDSTTETWGYAATGEVGGIVYQKDHIWLVIEQDIEIKDYEDPIRDLQGVNARAYVDAVYSQTDAAAQIIHD